MKSPKQGQETEFNKINQTKKKFNLSKARTDEREQSLIETEKKIKTNH